MSNGWSNEATYTVVSIIDNDEELYEKVQNRMTDEYAEEDLLFEDCVEGLAEDLGTLVNEIFEDDNIPELVKSLAMLALDEVDFGEIAETWLKDFRHEFY